MVVRQNFAMLQGGRRTRRLTRHSPELEEWLTYVETNYFAHIATCSPRRQSGVCTIVRTDTRTVNHLEGTVRVLSVTGNSR